MNGVRYLRGRSEHLGLSPSVLVRSIDLSPAGSLLATGSDDQRVRICKSRYSPQFALASIR